MAKLTVKEIVAAKGKDKPYKLTVERGLYLRIATNGEKRWIVRYMIFGKQKEARLPKPFGSSSAGYMSLADAISENARIQALARKNIDFLEQEAEEAENKKRLIEEAKTKELTFNNLFDLWIKDGVSRSDNNAYLIGSFNRHALPMLGNIRIMDLSELHLLKLYRGLVDAEIFATALELSKDIKQMLSWAEKRKPWRSLLLDGNPADLVNIRNVLPKNYSKERDRVLSIEELRKLNQTFKNMTKVYQNAENKNLTRKPLKAETQIAVWICLGTLCRIGELMKARWENVDFIKRTWHIPAIDTKGEAGKKRAQTVSLSDFTFEKFLQLHKLTGGSAWLFPAINNEGHVCEKSASKQIGDRQVMFKNRTTKLKNRVEDNSLVVGMLKWTLHDMRRTGATMMQQLKIPRDIINLCQNHSIGSKVDRHYLHYDYLEEKKEAWYKLGNYLESTLFELNVVSFKTA